MLKIKWFIPIVFLLISCVGGGKSGQGMKDTAEIHRLPAEMEITDLIWVFKTIDGQELEAHIYLPADYDALREEPYTAVAWFHGGGWNQGEASWGSNFIDLYSIMGCVAVSFDYRLATGKNTMIDCIEDAHSAMGWLRENAEILHIDSNRIIASGDSAGAHLALSTALFPQYRDSREDLSISTSPDRIFAICPPVYLKRASGLFLLMGGEERLVNVSPGDNITSNMPPLTLWIAEDDEIIPLESLVRFDQAVKEMGNSSVLYVYEGGEHAFHYSDGVARTWIWARMEEILKEIDWI